MLFFAASGREPELAPAAVAAALQFEADGWSSKGYSCPKLSVPDSSLALFGQTNRPMECCDPSGPQRSNWISPILSPTPRPRQGGDGARTHRVSPCSSNQSVLGGLL